MKGLILILPYNCGIFWMFKSLKCNLMCNLFAYICAILKPPISVCDISTYLIFLCLDFQFEIVCSNEKPKTR